MFLEIAFLVTGVLWVQSPEPARAFADVFGAVLRIENPDGGTWGDPSEYLEAPAGASIALKPIPTKYRVLVAPGFLSACAASAAVFEEGRRHLREKHRIDAELLQLPNDSSEANAKRIAEYLRGKMAENAKKYIVVGHSKGAVDLQVALQDAAVAASVAAFISVAGAIGGSPLADLMPGGMEDLIARMPSPECAGDLAASLRSLRREERRAFLERHPAQPAPSYALVAVSDKRNTSKALLHTWFLLSFYGSRQDGQILAEDAILPGAKNLGVAKADHLAVAQSFDRTVVSAMFDHGRYPRVALLEALVRFAIADLEAK
jgi:hypothetical protein